MKAICLPRRNRSSFWAFCSSRLTFFLKWEFWMILFKAEAILAAYGLRVLGKPDHPSAPWSDQISTRVRLKAMAARVDTGPSASRKYPRSRTATLEPGRVKASPSPYVGLTAHIEPSPRFGNRRARPASDPVDSDSGASLPWSPPKIEPKLARALDVSPHRRSCPG